MKANLYQSKSKNNTHSTTEPYHRKPSDSNTNSNNRMNDAYTFNYHQACSLLQAIQMNGRRRLSQSCVYNLANFVTRSWESNPKQEKIEDLAKFMTNLLDTTLLCPEKPFEEALQQFCRSHIPTQSVSPTVTILIAIGYIERLKQKYKHIQGTSGCAHRLIMIAYMIAAKFMHANLKSIIHTSPSALNGEKDTPTKKLPPIMPPCSEQELLPSPPTSPKTFYSDSDPLKYHYFQSRSKSTTFNNITINTNNTTNNNPSGSTSTNERHFQIIRMEHEFLHFLDYDLSLSNTLKLIHWAHNSQDNPHYTISSVFEQ
ncbi:uncharacterized protein B0P05DRAFT_542229 [Gilbertella persicaria]|uniref:uncharacterized protein n=1 Tax=Gilbertella persicaria TaxID=101096 RepID=UPI002220ACDB|nr:uncharacterized protein B0P05DRAFT_542229 [Gilbertella persicaria]KAI8079070.1 hypothetical protein B0P05DRAFT_542229 [Gilbertella persicaria]